VTDDASNESCLSRYRVQYRSLTLICGISQAPHRSNAVPTVNNENALGKNGAIKTRKPAVVPVHAHLQERVTRSLIRPAFNSPLGKQLFQFIRRPRPRVAARQMQNGSN